MSAVDFVAGPVFIDGQRLHFFVRLDHPLAALQVWAATYTVVFMNDKASDLEFSAYAQRRTRMTEDDWYGVAKEHFDLHLAVLSGNDDTSRVIREVVESHYFGKSIPATLVNLLGRGKVAGEGAHHAA